MQHLALQLPADKLQAAQLQLRACMDAPGWAPAPEQQPEELLGTAVLSSFLAAAQARLMRNSRGG